MEPVKPLNPLVTNPNPGSIPFHKAHKSLYIWVFCIMAVAGAGFIYLLLENFRLDQDIFTTLLYSQRQKHTFKSVSPVSPAVKDWKKTEVDSLAVSFLLPPDWQVLEAKEAGLLMVGPKAEKENAGKPQAGVVIYSIKNPNKTSFKDFFGGRNSFLGIDPETKFAPTSLGDSQVYGAVSGSGVSLVVVPRKTDFLVISTSGQSQVYTDFVANIRGQGAVEVSLLKVCPEGWYQDAMPGPKQAAAVSKEYYIYKDQRRELSEFDASWVKDNCEIEKQIVY